MIKVELTTEQYNVLTTALVDASKYQQRRAVEVMGLMRDGKDDAQSWNDACEAEAARHMVLAHQDNEVRKALLAAKVPKKMYVDCGGDIETAPAVEELERQMTRWNEALMAEEIRGIMNRRYHELFPGC